MPLSPTHWSFKQSWVKVKQCFNFASIICYQYTKSFVSTLLTLWWIAMESSHLSSEIFQHLHYGLNQILCIHDPQMMNHNVGLFLESHNEFEICGFKLNVSITVGWIALKFEINSHSPQDELYRLPWFFMKHRVQICICLTSVYDQMPTKHDYPSVETRVYCYSTLMIQLCMTVKRC